MKLLLTLFFTLNVIYASNLLNYKIYDRKDRLDILLTFDTPFDGRISQKTTTDGLTLLLYDASYEKRVDKKLDSTFIKGFSIVPQNNRTALILDMDSQTKYSVSKTVDNYGLRLRFESKNNFSKATLLGSNQSIKNVKSLPTKPENINNNRYFLVVSILIIAVILLFIFKRKVEKSRGLGPWLFKGKAPHNIEKFNIIFQKPLDNQNKVVMLEFGERQYLAVIGTSNLLLDTFTDKESVADEDGFENVLRQNQQELDKYMKIDHVAKTDPMQSYKEKASLETYRLQQMEE